MHGGDDVGAGGVHGGVDGEAGRVDGVHVALGLHDALLVDEAEVRRLHVAEGLAEGVDPEVVGFEGVADGDVPARALVVVPVLAEPADGGGLVEFAEGALVEGVGEGGDADLGYGVGLRAGDGVGSVDESTVRLVRGMSLKENAS